MRPLGDTPVTSAPRQTLSSQHFRGGALGAQPRRAGFSWSLARDRRLGGLFCTESFPRARTCTPVSGGTRRWRGPVSSPTVVLEVCSILRQTTLSRKLTIFFAELKALVEQ